uniref:Uncharacterized protein n=1 Tax=Octopus bimaculoides TaxID=37653 RepID=A0A0L8GTI0_OCTBM
MSPSSLGFMFQQRWWPVYGRMAAVMLVYFYGSYESYRFDITHASSFRNRSKLFGGRELPEGKEAW